MVGCNGYRNPALYAKIASTVDVASHGRLDAGIGAGWYEHEWRAYGYEWDDTPVRMAKFREAVEIIHKMWTEDGPDLPWQALLDRRADQRTEGGVKAADPALDRRRRRAGDAQAGREMGRRLQRRRRQPGVCRQKLAILQRHCQEQGRDYDEIIKLDQFGLLCSGSR